MNAKKVSVIIVNYNTTKLVKECIESILRLTKNIEYEIIVVDNMSSDRSIEEIENYPKVKLIKNKENYGFGKANNIGIKEADGKYIFLLNSDTLLLNNAIKIFQENYIKLDNVGCLGTILKDKNGKNNYSYGKFPTIKEVFYLRMSYYLNKLLRRTFVETEISQLKEVDFVTGAALFIEKDIFKKVQGFDELFFMYYEETDLQFRLRELGYKNYIMIGPEIIHYDGSSWNKVKNFKRIIADRSMFYYFKKNNKSEYFWLKKLYILIFFITIFQYTFAENKKYLKEYRTF